MNASDMKEISFLDMIHCAFPYLSESQQATFAHAIALCASNRVARQSQPGQSQLSLPITTRLLLSSDQGGAAC